MNVLFNNHNLALLLITAILLTSCKKTDEPQVQASSPFVTNLVGKWQWVKTVTEGTEITPQTEGYTESLSYGNDGGFGGNYLLISRDGGKAQAMYQNNAFGSTNLIEQSITGQFGSQYIKFILIKNSDNTYQNLITSGFVNDYNQGYGSTQHYYQRAGVPDKP